MRFASPPLMLAVAAAALHLAACAAPAGTNATPIATAVDAPRAEAAARDVDVASLQRDLASDAVGVLIDVRTPAEFADGHVPGAVNIPLDVLDASLDDLRDHDGAIYVICRSGSRSRAATDRLERAGIAAVNVRGGTQAWVASGGPLD